MVREERTIEVTLISATDLKKVKKFGREQKNYVSAYIYPARRQSTAADPYGGVNPMWNSTLKLACYESDIHPSSSSAAPSADSMTLEIYSHGGGIFNSPDKLVGTVSVPLQQVASAAQAGGTMPAFLVHLPTESGEAQGSLNLSVKLGAKRELGHYEDLAAAAAAPLSSHSDQAS